MPHAPVSLPDCDAWTDVDLAKKQLRDSAYYEERLKRDHPTIYGDLKAGKYGTVADAAIAAGLKKPRTRLQELKNAWMKANAREQRDFLQWLAARGVVLSPAASGASSTSTSIAVDRRLTVAASLRIEEIMSKRRLKVGEVMSEMGYSHLNASVGMALARGTRLKGDVIKALEVWLTANASV